MSWLKRIFSKPEKKKDLNAADTFNQCTNEIKSAGTLDGGDHYADNVDLIKQLKKDKKYDEAIGVLLKSVALTENESKKANSKPVLEENFAFLSEGRSNSWGVSPWYYEQLAIIYRQQKKYADEVSILERYESQPKAPGVGPHKLAERLIKARELLENNHA